MNTVERIKSICKERKIAISKLEKDCGFSNGYIGQLKKGTVPDDRLRIIADYLKISSEELKLKEKQIEQVNSFQNSLSFLLLSLNLFQNNSFADFFFFFLKFLFSSFSICKIEYVKKII